MREFILLSLKGKTSPDFNLEDLPGAGRIDLVCRTVSNILFISNALRRDTIVHISLNGPKSPPKMITFNGDELKGVEPDERSIATVIKTALKHSANLQQDEEKEVSPGVFISNKSFERLVKEKSKRCQLIYLHPKGEDIREAKFEENFLVIFGDYIGLPKNTEKLIERLGAKKISIGPIMLFASHCPVIIHNELDRRLQ